MDPVPTAAGCQEDRCALGSFGLRLPVGEQAKA